jgi:cellulose synthase/poly-beta-1,6-N-acetylglucosamine synthase-like glycosyltransferase
MLWSIFLIACLAQPVYTLIVYPLLLGILAKWYSHPIRSEEQTKRVSFIIPVRNGERFIAEKLGSILALDYPKDLMDLLVVSDASTDRTESIVETFACEGVRLLRVPGCGKPAAINAAIPRTQGEILVLTDVRQILDPDSLRFLVNCFADPTVGVVSGNLVIRGKSARGDANVELYWRYEMWIRNQLSRIDSIFGAVGPFYAIRRELVVPIPRDVLLDDVYLPLASFFRGYRLIVEMRARVYDYPTTLKVEFRRKVRTIAGFYQILMKYPALFGFRNRMLFHFISYKFGRLLMPYSLLAALMISIFVPIHGKLVILLAESISCALAVLDPLIPSKFLLKRVSSPIRTFAVFMVATLLGLQILFVSPRTLWKETMIIRDKV